MAEKKQHNSGEKKAGGSTLSDSLFDMLNADNVMSNAQRVISSAVNVLEEEIAAGILAAKRIEKKVIDVESVRGNPEDLMSRIRRDTHEAIDIFLDAFAALSKQMGLLSGSLANTAEQVKTAAAAATPAARASNTFSAIESDKPVKAGEAVQLFMAVGDPDSKETIAVQLQKTDFSGPAGQKILSRYLQIQPASFELKPGEEKEIELTIKPPLNTKPGKYSSLVTDANNLAVRTVILIEVTA